MGRTTEDAKLTTPTARSRLVARGEPYYRTVQKGLALGYRRGLSGGVWLARIRVPDTAKYTEVKIGSADDLGTAEAASALAFDLATVAAREAFVQAEARRVSGTLPAAGKATVDDVLALYRHAYKAGETGRREEPGRDLVNLDSIFKCHLQPRLGTIPLGRLTEKRLKTFKKELIDAPRLSRSGNPVPFDKEDDDFDESEALRKRKARANRVMTTLRAALNYGLKEKWFSSDAAWRTALKPYPGTDVASIRYLEVEECDGLKAAVEQDFCHLVRGALQTGCRYGSLRHLKCKDVNLKASTALIRVTKSGEVQTIHLKHEGVELLGSLMSGRRGNDYVFTKSDGSQEALRPAAPNGARMQKRWYRSCCNFSRTARYLRQPSCYGRGATDVLADVGFTSQHSARWLHSSSPGSRRRSGSGDVRWSFARWWRR